MVVRALRIVGWCAFLLAALWILDRLGTGPLAPPPTEVDALGPWLGDRQPVEAAFALIRLAGLGLGWYLLAASLLGGLARLSRRPGLVRLTDLATAPFVRRLLGGMLGLGLTATTARAATAPAPHPVMVEIASASATNQDRGAEDDGDHTVVMRVVEPPSASSTWTVAPGDHLWSIAEATLARTWGRNPADTEVRAYWRSLIDDNRDRLVVADDPDLIFAGQTFRLPNVPSN